MFKSKMEDYWDMNTIKVSIITVSYNAVDTIEQTILSVLNQSYRNVEYIIIDGQSTDGTQEVIEKYKDKLAYYVSEPDGGIYDAMNKGIKQATGDVIGIINSDDWYELDAVANIVSCLESGDVEIVHGKIKYIHLNDSVSYSQNMPLNEMWMHMSVSHPSCFVKREVYQRWGLFDTKYRIAADYEFMLRCYSSEVKFKYIDKVIANFRYGGISTTDTAAVERETLKIAKVYMDKCFDWDRETLLELWEQKDSEVRLKEMLLYNPQILESYLEQVFPDINNGIYIFGAGFWGEKCCIALQNSQIHINGVVDNDNRKWGEKLAGIPIESPDILKADKKNILITARNYADDICRQLEGIGNMELEWTVLGDIKKRLGCGELWA